MQQYEFTTFDIMRIFDVQRERLRQWMNLGYVKPGIQSASGVGSKNLFSKFDLYRIAFFLQLLQGGLSRDQASVYSQGIRDSQLEARPQHYILYRQKSRDVDGNTIMRATGWQFGTIERTEAGHILWMLDDQDCDDVLIVNFSKLMAEVDSKV